MEGVEEALLSVPEIGTKRFVGQEVGAVRDKVPIDNNDLPIVLLSFRRDGLSEAEPGGSAEPMQHSQWTKFHVIRATSSVQRAIQATAERSALVVAGPMIRGPAIRARMNPAIDASVRVGARTFCVVPAEAEGPAVGGLDELPIGGSLAATFA